MRLTPANAASPVAGFSWLSDWELPFEGGYSLLSKFAWANGAGASELCNTVFGRKPLNSDNVGRHGRSLLDVGWAHGDNLGVPYLRDKAVQGALVSRAGRWTRLIAADNVLRYCRSCLAHGYQSALYQIDGMLSCPIHNEPLQSGCSHCGAAGQRYAITEPGFATPFHCPVCMAPLAGSFNCAIWNDPAFRNAAYTHFAPITQWLHRLSESTLKWHEWDQWYFPMRWHCSEEERRIAALEVVLAAFPPPTEVKALRRRRQAPQVYLGALTTVPQHPMLRRGHVGSENTGLDRMMLYKAVRRYVSRRLRGCSRVAIRHLLDIIQLSGTDGAMCLSAKGCPRAQALALWRFHFEAAQRDPHVLVLRPSVLQWPLGGTIDAAAWAGYCLASFHAAVAAFDAWHAQAKLLRDVDLLGGDQARARALHTQFAPLLAPAILPTFPAVSYLTFTDENLKLRLLVIGPADMVATASGSRNPGIWCDCQIPYGRGCACTARAQAAAVLSASAACGEHQERKEVNLAYFLPMNKLSLPPALNGSVFKSDRDRRRCSYKAENDLEAISLWLADCTTLVTRRSYAQQIEKVLLWCVAQRGIALSQMSVDDVNDFTDFLANPVPRDVWLPTQTNGAPRRWSPFRKAPSPRTQDHIFRVLSALFQHWSSLGFILENPCSKSKRGLQAAQWREAEIPPPAKREALVTNAEWGYLTDAAGSPLGNMTVCLILRLSYFAALNPAEVGAIRLQDIRRMTSTTPSVDIWSIAIPTRTTHRQEVFLMTPLTSLLGAILPASTTEFLALVQNNPDLYLIDLLNPAPFARRTDSSAPPTGQALSSWLKPVFRSAARHAERAGDLVAAQRLDKVTLYWVSNALEKHLEMNGKTGCDCWLALGACKLCPPTMLGYLPSRLSQSAVEIERAMNGVLLALGDANA